MLKIFLLQNASAPDDLERAPAFANNAGLFDLAMNDGHRHQAPRVRGMAPVAMLIQP
jgi:hypothetical protein